jgi:hypothetical protein
MKLMPLALLSLSSAGEIPSMIEGVLSTSSVVKNHWFGSASGVSSPDREGVCWLDTPCGLGGDVRALC